MDVRQVTPELLRRLAKSLLGEVSESVTPLWGILGPADLVDVLATITAGTNLYGAGAALSMSGETLSHILQYVPEVADPTNLIADKALDLNRLRSAFERVLFDREQTPEQAQERAYRIVENELTDSVRHGYAERIKHHDGIVGWRRAIEPDACELCTDLAADGTVFNKDLDMYAHTNCKCTQAWVYET